jgi:hypothetical protein
MNVLPKQKTRIIKKFSYFLNNLKYKNSQITNNIFSFLFKFLLIKKILNFYSWESKMPSAYMMWKFDKFLEVEKLKFIISEI